MKHITDASKSNKCSHDGRLIFFCKVSELHEMAKPPIKCMQDKGNQSMFHLQQMGWRVSQWVFPTIGDSNAKGWLKSKALA